MVVGAVAMVEAPPQPAMTNGASARSVMTIADAGSGKARAFSMMVSRWRARRKENALRSKNMKAIGSSAGACSNRAAKSSLAGRNIRGPSRRLMEDVATVATVIEKGVVWLAVTEIGEGTVHVAVVGAPLQGEKEMVPLKVETMLKVYAAVSPADTVSDMP